MKAYAIAGSHETVNVHVEDAGSLYVLALQHAKAGSIYHCANGTASGKQIAEAIAVKHSLGVHSISADEASQLYGPFLAQVFNMNNLIASNKARTELNWQPKYDLFLQYVAGKEA